MLQAAARLFGRKRFHEVRMEDVAEEAGVGKGTIYRYFEDKDELYLSLLERAGEQLLQRIDKALAAAKSPCRRLEGLIAASLLFFDAQPHLFDLIQRADAMRGSHTPWQKTRTRIVRHVQQIFADAKEKGEFEVADPTTSALMLLGGIRALIRFGPQPRPAALARRIVALFLNGAAES
jgi:TetR/AcrR family fatty acid metabolism transcriptional regulator